MNIEHHNFTLIKFKLISDYLGLSEYTLNNVGELNFNTSWEALMPVIEKISKTKFSDGDTYYPRTFGMLDDNGNFMFRFNRHQLFTSEKLIDCAFDAVIDCLESIEIKP